MQQRSRVIPENLSGIVFPCFVGATSEAPYPNASLLLFTRPAFTYTSLPLWRNLADISAMPAWASGASLRVRHHGAYFFS